MSQRKSAPFGLPPSNGVPRPPLAALWSNMPTDRIAEIHKELAVLREELRPAKGADVGWFPYIASDSRRLTLAYRATGVMGRSHL